jgi:hypothetical protein
MMSDALTSGRSLTSDELRSDNLNDLEVPHSLDRFNARDMTASEVATRFVTPGVFQAIRSASNTLLIGPRGSGKTTLLKMLTPEGAEVWNQRLMGQAAHEFSGVYIPIDVQLADQLDAIAASELPRDVIDTTVQSIYALHVFRCVADTLSWHCGTSSRRSSVHVVAPQTEAAIIEQLALLWGLPLVMPRVAELQASLRRRQARSLEWWTRAALIYRRTNSVDLTALDIVEFDSGLKGALELLSRELLWPSAGRWAALFDEVEVAPEPLQRLLLSYLRQSDEKVFFKLAIAPYMQGYRGLPDRSRGSALNDYGVVDLTNDSEESVRQFSFTFFATAAAGRNLPYVDMGAALGPSLLNPRSDGATNNAAYAVGSEQAKRFRNLARKDSSFARYLEDNVQILTETIPAGDSDERAPFRKSRQVALVREAYFSDIESSGRRIKSQSSARRLYAGAETIVKLCEGNPRRLAFVTPHLVDELNTRGRVSVGQQVFAVQRAEVAFRSFLRGLPVSERLGSILPRGVLSFVDLFGNLFHGEIVMPEFTDDPIGSFVVDSAAGPLIEEAISRAVNAGALVQLSDTDERGSLRQADSVEPMATARGKRFRLSYLLCPTYGLVVRRCRAVAMSTLLKRARESSALADRRIANGLLSGQDVLL